MTTVTPSNEFLNKDPAWALNFAPNGTLLGIGDKMMRKRYANTLEKIAIEGPNAFYTEGIARTTIDAIKKTGGIMILEDFANYMVTFRKPVAIEHKDYRLMSVPAPASGAVVLQTFKVLEGYPKASSVGLSLSTHRFDEAIKFSAYNPVLIENLDALGTSQITVADISGPIISMTITINTLFGSHVFVPETGVILNNKMNNFSIPGVSNDKGFQPSTSNFFRPGKKPVSSMSLTIVEHFNGTFYAALGAGGGSRIITANIQNLWHILHHNLTAVEVLAQPRFHDQLMFNLMAFEYAYDNSTVAFLRSLSHNVFWVAPGQSYAQVTRRLGNGIFEAASELRLAEAEELTI